ncbi:MAG: hypothetical protein RSB41_04000 [Bacilli bacterium]
MKIEILYSEIGNLYGDNGNIRYLEKCLKDEKFYYTSINDTPHFVKEKIDFIYMGPMSEENQEKTIIKLLPYKNRLKELINNNTIFLCTGNSWEIFGKDIRNEDGTIIECLDIFDTYAKRYMLDRYAGLVLGTFKDIKIVGFKNQFTHSYGNNTNNYFLEVIKGSGLNPSSSLEGIHYKNFFGTYLLGPILILNPDFTKYLLSLLGIKNITLPFEEEIYKTYNKRLEEFINQV